MILRRILLGGVSLAIIVACYLLYTMLFVPAGYEEPATRTPVQTKIPPSTTTKPARPLNMTSPTDALLSGLGDKPYFERYSRNRLLYQFRSEHWRPIGTGSGRYALENPELNLCLRGGQVVRVSATEGEVETVQTKSSKMEPKRGELRGKVHIAIDRGTDPKRSDMVLRPEDTMHIWLDRVKFDLIQNFIESDSPLKVESEEVELLGESLSLTWNSVTNQIEEITIKSGKKLVIRQGLDLISPDMPLADTTRKTGKSKAALTGTDKRAGKMAFTRNTVSKSDLVFPSSPKEKKATTTAPKHRKSTTQSTQPRTGKSYDLVFTSAVRIFQYDGQKLTGKMNCDRLHVIFDAPKGSDSNGLGARSGPTSRPVADKGGKRLEVFWEGPLQMLPKDLAPSPIRRFHIVAEGLPIQIDQMEQGTVRCKQLTYHQETRQLWLDGTAEDPVNVSQGEARTIVAPHLFYDRKLGIASGKGPGFMQQQPKIKPVAESGGEPTGIEAGQKMMVLWKEGFQLNIGEYTKAEPTGEQTTKQFIKRAEFRGSASLRRPGVSMAGDLVIVNFLGPQVKNMGDSSDQIKMLHAERDVELQSDQQRITCELLDVEFGEGNVPQLAKAKGHVIAQEGKRVIRADRLTAVMEEKPVVPTTTATAETAKGIAARKKAKTRIVLREVDAGGNVSIRDPDQSVDVDTEKMHAIIDPNGTIRWCYLEGAGKTWTRAKLRDYALAGEKITMDLGTEQIDIPGPGGLTFVNRQDFLGGERTKATPIEIRWSESMKMTGGKKNQGTFLGKTEVQSDRTTLYCGRLVVDFENAPPAAKAPETSLKDSMWVFSRLIERPGKNTGGMQLSITRKRPIYIQAFPNPGKRVNVQYLVKEGKETLNRTTLWGNELRVDLTANKLDVPGPGEFFIEDYQKAAKTRNTEKKAKPVAVRELDDPFSGDFQAEGPSQTRFSWKRGLVYLLDGRTAIFDGTVYMLHASGPAVSAKPSGKPITKENLRMSELTCDNLKAEFLRGGLGFSDPMQPGAAGLKSVVATGAVHLTDKPRSVMAQRLLFNKADNIIAIYGGDGSDAYLYEENEDTGQYSSWNGPWIMWDRKTGDIRCPNAAVITTMR